MFSSGTSRTDGCVFIALWYFTISQSEQPIWQHDAIKPCELLPVWNFSNPWRKSLIDFFTHFIYMNTVSHISLRGIEQNEEVCVWVNSRLYKTNTEGWSDPGWVQMIWWIILLLNVQDTCTCLWCLVVKCLNVCFGLNDSIYSYILYSRLSSVF